LRPVLLIGLGFVAMALARGAPALPAAWLDTRPGDLPVILAAPHGGTLNPDELPDRTAGVIVSDAHTSDLALRVAAALRQRSGAAPHVVLCRVHRVKVDCNREIGEAAGGHPVAEALWDAYHQAVREARSRVAAQWPVGLYVEIHGHSHLLPLVELGYAIPPADLNRAELPPDLPSSVRDLHRRSAVSLEDLIRGPRSLGALLEAEGFPAIPSPSHPAPGTRPYFSGGYGIATHGSRHGGTISGIQVEVPRKTARDSEENRDRFANALAAALAAYASEHLGAKAVPQ